MSVTTRYCLPLLPRRSRLLHASLLGLGGCLLLAPACWTAVAAEPAEAAPSVRTAAPATLPPEQLQDQGPFTPDLSAIDPAGVASSVPALEGDSAAAPDINALSFGYLDAQQLALLPPERRRRIPAACRGVWITPIAPTTKAGPADSATTVAQSEYAYHDPRTGSVLSGQVRIEQPGRLVTADQVQVDADQTTAVATGNVVIAEAGLSSAGDRAVIRLDGQQAGEVSNSRFVSETQQAGGQAGRIYREEDGVTRIEDVEYSACDPENRVWNLKAGNLRLDNNSGRGVARNTTLLIKNIPVSYSPYFNFPLDDRRMSGFLYPQIGYGSRNGLDLAVPYYFNIAPNLDATLTPRILSRRGLMLEGEVRWLTRDWGNGQLNGAFLPSDRKYEDQDRYSITGYYNLPLTRTLSSSFVVNDASDRDYFQDFSYNPLTGTIDHLENRASLYYRNGIPGLTSELRAVKYTTINDRIPDVGKPFDRLPQLLTNYRRDLGRNWQLSAESDIGWFRREVDDGIGESTDAARLYHDVSAGKTWRKPWGYLSPVLTARDVRFSTRQGDAGRDTSSATVPQLTLDSGLTFERETSRWTQTLEPRLFYAYAPFVDQRDLPVLDSDYLSPSYYQLFRANRFTGHDRLDDNHFITPGLTNRWYDLQGRERFRIGIAQRFHLADRRVVLRPNDPVQTDSRSGWAAELGGSLRDRFNYSASFLLNPDNRLTTASADLQYRPAPGRIYSLGYFERTDQALITQVPYRQLTASFIQPLNSGVRIMGYSQYDLLANTGRDQLLGVDYDGCCYRVGVYARRYYNDLDDILIDKPNNQVRFELTLKGLGGVRGALLPLLQQKILGFTEANRYWSER